jgi:hypothetical protein
MSIPIGRTQVNACTVVFDHAGARAEPRTYVSVHDNSPLWAAWRQSHVYPHKYSSIAVCTSAMWVGFPEAGPILRRRFFALDSRFDLPCCLCAGLGRATTSRLLEPRRRKLHSNVHRLLCLSDPRDNGRLLRLTRLANSRRLIHCEGCGSTCLLPRIISLEKQDRIALRFRFGD